jgi:ribosomal-protein-alanine N-acetyltransferase
MNPTIRWLVRSDLPAVLPIEQASFHVPWSEEDFLAELRDKRTIGLVADIDGRVVGYVVYEMTKQAIQIRNLAVHPDCRRQGIGTAFIEKLMGKLCQSRRSCMSMLLCDRNTPGHLFLRACGFRAQLERGWYDDGTDAYCFRWRLPVLVE